MSAYTLPDRQELTGEGFFRDPYPYYRRLRSSAVPFWLSHKQDSSSGGLYLFSRYEDAQAVFAAAQGVSKNLRAMRPGGVGPAFDKHMLHRDGVDHMRLRRLVSDWFSAQSVERMKSLMREVASDLLAPALRKSDFDLVVEFAEPLPLHIIGRLVGVPVADMPQIRAWSLALNDGFDSLLADAAILQRQHQALGAFEAYSREQIEAKRRQPDSSLLGVLAQAGPDSLDDEELVAMVGLLLIAGHETTVSLIGNAMWLLLSHTEQWALLRAQPELVAGAVEETLRYESPAQRSTFRLVNAPLTINGYALEPGQQIGVFIGSANRDDAAFDNADDFDIRRTPNRHLSFGAGVHNCLGKTLARTETQIALQVLLENLSAPALREQRPDWRKNSFFRGLHSLWLTQGKA
jgi:pimeloyl-[acyl-carrier protein] synthase